MTRPLPGQPFPSLDLPRAGGGRIDATTLSAPFMTALVFYRGLHCPRCKAQLSGLAGQLEALADRGARVVAVSTDVQARAEQAVSEWGLGDMPVGYGLGIDRARALGLYVSETIREGEPAQFAEPAVFLIRADGVLWCAAVNSSPFLRPTAEMVIDAIDTAKARDYPPRGTI